jgi:hypothetical protein
MTEQVTKEIHDYLQSRIDRNQAAQELVTPKGIFLSRQPGKSMVAGRALSGELSALNLFFDMFNDVYEKYQGSSRGYAVLAVAIMSIDPSELHRDPIFNAAFDETFVNAARNILYAINESEAMMPDAWDEYCKIDESELLNFHKNRGEGAY